MRSALAIARKELQVFFTTPVAYVTFTVVAFFAAQVFIGSLDAYRALATRLPASPEGQRALAQLNLTDFVVARLFASVALFVLVSAPFLSMRLLAEERRGRTLELLLTSPVRPASIVAGKYLAALVVTGVSVAIVAAFPAILSLVARGARGGPAIEWRTVATGLLGLLLLGAMCQAVGLFLSALTESVVVAALLSLVTLLALWMVTLFTVGVEGPARDLAAGVSASEHLTAFLQGRIELKDLVYYLSFVVGGLWLAERAVEGHRWT